MGVGYILVNWTKKEHIHFLHIGADTARELASHPASAAITTWYMLHHLDDRVAFVTDSYDDWPFPDGTKDDLDTYREITDEVVTELVENRILIDEGRRIIFEDEPDIYLRELRMNGWAWTDEAWVPSEFERSLRRETEGGEGSQPSLSPNP